MTDTPLAQGPSSDAATRALILRVGARVRHVRQSQSMPRRELSERSGVSPRYLAQLEAGEGNISIGLLHRVARALDHSIEGFLGLDTAELSEPQRMAGLYRGAPADVQKAVRDLLHAGPVQRRAHRICLVGLRGAGKSTLGAMTGAALGLPFEELTREIETHSDMPMAEIIALYGPEGYRTLEADALERVVARHDDMVLAVAGGIVAAPETYATLLARFHTIWLRTAPEDHMARVRAQGDERPMAGNPQAMAQLRAILTAREPLYARAQAKVDTAGRSPDQSLADVLAVIAEQGFAGPGHA